MRISRNILIQDVEEAGVVILDDLRGAEIVIPTDVIHAAIEALEYFADLKVEPTEEIPWG